jgi:hypothetical protein
LIGLATQYSWNHAWIWTSHHVSHLSVELQPVESGVIDIGHAEQTQEPALEPAQLGPEDHGRSSPGSERVPLHVVEQVDHSAGRGTATLACDPRRERGVRPIGFFCQHMFEYNYEKAEVVEE